MNNGLEQNGAIFWNCDITHKLLLLHTHLQYGTGQSIVSSYVYDLGKHIYRTVA